MFKVGDKVKVTRNLTDKELKNFPYGWVRDMNEYIGTAQTITEVFDHYVRFKGYSWSLYILEPLLPVITLDLSKYKWVARDRGGSVYLYEEKPTVNDSSDTWDTLGDFCRLKTPLLIPNLGEDWRDSLHKILPDGTLIHQPQKHTITIDGKDIELSKESFDNIKKQLRD